MISVSCIVGAAKKKSTCSTERILIFSFLPLQRILAEELSQCFAHTLRFDAVENELEKREIANLVLKVSPDIMKQNNEG